MKQSHIGSNQSYNITCDLRNTDRINSLETVAKVYHSTVSSSNPGENLFAFQYSWTDFFERFYKTGIPLSVREQFNLRRYITNYAILNEIFLVIQKKLI